MGGICVGGTTRGLQDVSESPGLPPIGRLCPADAARRARNNFVRRRTES